MLFRRHEDSKARSLGPIHTTALFCPAHFAFFKQLKIVLLPITKICTDYFFCSLIYNNLTLYCMFFLFTRIKMFLLIVSIFYLFLLPDFFLGRSIGVSEASISRTSYSISLFKRALRPGKANTGSLIKP